MISIIFLDNSSAINQIERVNEKFNALLKNAHKDNKTVFILPSSFQAPSIWYAADAVPQRKSSGKVPLINSSSTGICTSKSGFLKPCIFTICLQVKKET